MLVSPLQLREGIDSIQLTRPVVVISIEPALIGMLY